MVVTCNKYVHPPYSYNWWFNDKMPYQISREMKYFRSWNGEHTNTDSLLYIIYTLSSKKHCKFVNINKFVGLTDTVRKHLMCQVNPRYVLRNWMAESAIKKAEKDDFSEVQFLFKVLQSPYTINEEAEKKGYADPPPKWACTINVSCSSWHVGSTKYICYFIHTYETWYGLYC